MFLLSTGHSFNVFFFCLFFSSSLCAPSLSHVSLLAGVAGGDVVVHGCRKTSLLGRSFYNTIIMYLRHYFLDINISPLLRGLMCGTSAPLYYVRPPCSREPSWRPLPRCRDSCSRVSCLCRHASLLAVYLVPHTSCCNRRRCRLWWRRRASPRVPRTRVPQGLAWWAAGAVRPPPSPPPPRAPGVSCRASSPGEGRLGQARQRVVLTGKRAARASDDGWSVFVAAKKEVQQEIDLCSLSRRERESERAGGAGGGTRQA